MHEYIRELHYIVAIGNISSILENGILCYELASNMAHTSVALEEVQERRAKKRIPGGQLLHRYVNLYLNARNPMLFRLMKNVSEDLCILRIDKGVIEHLGVVLTDRNASSDYVTFYTLSESVGKLDVDRIYARYWKHDDQIEEWEHKSIICAEVLVPHSVTAKHIIGAYVTSEHSRESLLRAGFDREILVSPDMFFNMQIQTKER